jgi:hypothetical protein
MPKRGLNTRSNLPGHNGPLCAYQMPERYRYLANLDKHDARSLIELSFYLSMDDFFINTLSKIADIFLQTRKL